MPAASRSLLLLVVLACLGLLAWWLMGGFASGRSGPSGSAGSEGPQHLRVEAPPADLAAGAEAAGADDADRERLGRQAAESEGPAEVFGRVLRAADGSPVAGAVVRLVWRQADQFQHKDPGLRDRHQVRDTQSTDAEGRFRFAARRGWLYELWAEAPGYPIARASDCPVGVEIRIALRPAARVAGVVVDPEGKPVPGCRVMLGGKAARLMQAETRSDAAGRFELPGLPAEPILLRSVHRAFAEDWRELDLEVGDQLELRIELKQGLELHGQVVDPAGRPIAGAALDQNEEFLDPVLSAADGSFRLPGVSLDYPPQVYCRRQGYGTAVAAPGSEPSRALRIVLHPAAAVHGRVRTLDGTTPAQVYVAFAACHEDRTPLPFFDWLPAEVDGEGQYRCADLHPLRRYWVFARAPGFGTRVHVLPNLVGAGEDRQLPDIILEPEASIAGRITDAEGVARAGVRLSLRGINADHLAWLGPGDPREGARPPYLMPRGMQSDAEGVFRWTGLGAGEYRLTAYPPSAPMGITQTVPLVEGEQKRGLRIEVGSGLSIRGVLRYPDGRAIVPKTLCLRLFRPRLGPVDCWVERGGEFAFEGLAEGSYRIELMWRRGHQGWVCKPVAQVQAGTEGLELRMQKARQLRGQVVDAEGRGVMALVWAQRTGGPGRAALHMTDAEGHFVIDVLPDFAGSLRAVPQGVRRGTRQATRSGVVAGDKDLVLRLR